LGIKTDKGFPIWEFSADTMLTLRNVNHSNFKFLLSGRHVTLGKINTQKKNLLLMFQVLEVLLAEVLKRAKDIPGRQMPAL
jgi:predicted Kef-type K+ transport protein